MTDYPKISDEPFFTGIKRWIELGGSPLIIHPDTGRSLLHDAAEFQDVVAIEYLIGLGCNPNVRDLYGQTSLHIAIDSEIDKSLQTGETLTFRVTKRLLERGANLSIRDKNGATPLDWLDNYGEHAKARFVEILGQPNIPKQADARLPT